MQIFNTYTGQKEELKTIEPGVVRMYLCGDTVYDYCHIGHARSKMAFDVVRRYLQYRGYRVTFVRNITDIDDKIIKRAAENNESPQALTERFTRVSYGNMHIEITVDDPKAYTKPWTVTIKHEIMLDTELIEFVCLENEKSTKHFVRRNEESLRDRTTPQ